MTDRLTKFRKQISALAICYEANVVTVILGPPGQGKSTLLETFAAAQHAVFRTFELPQMDPPEVRGFMIPAGLEGNRPSMKVLPPDWVLDLADTAKTGQRGVLFVDEITNANGEIRAAFLRGLDGSRRFGTVCLPYSVWICLAGNPTDSAENGYEFGPALANRLCHLADWLLPVEVVTKGLRTGQWPTIPLYEYPNLDQHLTWARQAIALYLEAQPGHLTMEPGLEARSQPWPSPRSWETCARLLGYARAARLADGKRPVSTGTRSLLIEGTVGTKVAASVSEFLDNLNLPNPRAVLADPASWPIHRRGDIVQVVVTGVLTELEEHPNAGWWVNAGKFLAAVIDAGKAEIAQASLGRWTQIGMQHSWTHLLPSELGPGSRFDELHRQLAAAHAV